MIWLYIILHLIASFLLLYNCNFLIAVFTNKTKKINISIFSIMYFVCAILYCIIHVKLDIPIVDYILFLLYYLFLFLYIQKAHATKLSTSLYVIALYLSISSVFLSVISFFISLFYKNYLDQIIKLSTTIIIYLLFLLLIIKLSSPKTNKYSIIQINTIPKYVYILILLATFFSGGLIENQLTVTNIQVQGTFNKSFTIITIFLLIFIIASLVFNCILKAYFENVSSILEKQVNAQVDYYKKVDRLNKDLRDFRHDYKNHMICVQGLLDAHQYDEAREYVHGITLRKTILSREFASGNSIADSLLSDKAERAERIGAELQFKGVIFEDIPSVDLCTILSNALDNAIEACEKISSNEPKIILVKCSYIKHIQFIWISNPVAEDVKIINNTVETSKADKNIHGIGLYNIRRTVAKYEGEFEISCNDKMFVMDIGFKVD